MPTVTELAIHTKIVKPVAETIAGSGFVNRAQRKHLSGTRDDVDSGILTQPITEALREARLTSQLGMLSPGTFQLLVDNLTTKLKEFETHTQLSAAEITINKDFSVSVTERKASTALTTKSEAKSSLSSLPHDVVAIIHKFIDTKNDRGLPHLTKMAHLFLYSGIDFLTGLGLTTRIKPSSKHDTKLITSSCRLKGGIEEEFAKKGEEAPFVKTDPITELDLSSVGGALTDEMLIKIISSNPGLKSINLSDCCKVTDTAIQAVAKECPGLQQLNVSGCDNLTDAAIIAVAKRCKGLQQLNVSNYKNLTDAAIIAVAEKCPGLQQLDVRNCGKLTDAAIIAVAKGCPGLQQLNVRWCNNLTDAAIKAVAERCPGLQQLSIGNCNNLTNAAIIAVAERCPGLQQLYVNDCNNLTNAAIIAVAEKCERLQQLNIRGCDNLTDAAIIAVAAGCPKLERLDVSWCRKLTNAAMQELYNSHPNPKLVIMKNGEVFKRIAPPSVATSFAEKYAGEGREGRGM